MEIWSAKPQLRVLLDHLARISVRSGVNLDSVPWALGLTMLQRVRESLAARQ
jgi:hypothetical protein